MTPLERAARALCHKDWTIRDCSDPDSEPYLESSIWDELTDVERAGKISQARALLAAIREPSKSMLRLDNRYPGNLSEEEERNRRAGMRADWHAMIDAMLEEG